MKQMLMLIMLTLFTATLLNADVLNITDSPYNAVSDDDICDSNAIQDAIDDANDAGGGTVYIPIGVWDVNTPLQPRDNVTIAGEGPGSILNALGNCFYFNKTAGTGYVDTSRCRFFNFMIQGKEDNSGYAFLLGDDQNVKHCDIERVYVYSEIGGIYVPADSAITGFSMMRSSVANSDLYGFYAADGAELNNMIFDRVWFLQCELGAVKCLEGTGGALFQSCNFESCISQYTVYLTNPQATFQNCNWTNNGTEETTPHTDGADLYLATGNQPNIKLQGCRFGNPDDNAIGWTHIIDGITKSPLIVEGCYAKCDDPNLIAFYEFTGSGVCAATLNNNRFAGGETKELIQRNTKTSLVTDNNIGATPNLFNVTDVVVSLETDDNTNTRIWGDTYLGPYYTFPDANSIVLYEADIVAKNSDSSVYVVRKEYAVVQIEETSKNVFSGTVLTTNETTYDSAGSTLTSTWAITNNNTWPMGIVLTVRGLTSETIRWVVRIRALGAITPSTL